MAVAICVFRSRHGEMVTAYNSIATAHQVIATRSIPELLNTEIEDASRRTKVRALIEGGLYEEAIEAFHDAQAGSMDICYFEFHECEVESTPAPAPKCQCPKCGNEDIERLEIKETYSAYHPIDAVNDGKLYIENALTTTCPSEHFDDGAGDYRVLCKECIHENTPEAFGLPPVDEWGWV